MHLLQTLGYANQTLNTLQQGSISSSACQGSNMQAMGDTYDVSGTPSITTPSVNTQVERPQYRASFSPFTSSTAQSGQSIYPLPDSQQNSITPLSSRGSASAPYGSGLTPRKFNDSNSPNSSAASSSGSSGRFANFGNASSALGVNSPYYENGAFQANDLLRRDSHSLFSGISLSSPSHSQDFAPMSSRFQQQSQVQAQPQGFSPKDDGVLQDLNGTLACLDLGGEPYMARGAVDRGGVFSSRDIFGEGGWRNQSVTSSKQPADNLHM